MLRKLLVWALDDGSGTDAADAMERERRLDRRHDAVGAAVAIRSRRAQSIIHLRNLSCRGACGISDVPLAVGALIFVQLKPRRFHAAEVRWVRNASIGLRFVRPLDPDYVAKLPRRHAPRDQWRPVFTPYRVFTRR